MKCNFWKVLGGRWGERHMPGDVIELDWAAAEVRYNNGEIEPAQKVEEPVEETTESVPEEESAAVEELVQYPAESVSEAWCDSCDSRGVRHKKVCPKNTR